MFSNLVLAHEKRFCFQVSQIAAQKAVIAQDIKSVILY